MKKTLLHTGEFEAKFFAWVIDINAGVKISADYEKNKMICVCENDSSKTPINYNERISFKNAGIYSFTFSKGEKANITLEYDDGIYPFLLNGPGIMPKIEAISAMWLPKGTESFYVAVPDVIKRFSISYNSKRIEDVKVYDNNGQLQETQWEPELDICPYHVNDFYSENKSGYWRIDFNSIENDFKFNENNGLAIFLEKPPVEFQYNYFKVENDQELDYRVSVKRNGHIDAVFDILYNEEEIYPVVPGMVEFVYSAGFCYKEKSVHLMTKDENNLQVHFTKTLDIPKGWLRGDLHVHSCYEDACSMPQRITKAGRCNGLDFMFLTDHGGKKIIDNGLYTWEDKERFLPLPGQECVNERTHMNFLNVPFNIDYKDKTEGEWIENSKAKNPDGNEYVKMLNHPSHLPQATKGWWCTHFRSWWVATEHKDIELVENFDFRTWYDCLTRGRKLTGIWTTDTHDGTIEKPGNNCSFVYTGGELSGQAIVKALKEGRVTNSFYLGAFLNITAGDKMIGDTATNKDGKVKVNIEGTSNIQMDRIELVVNGIIVKTWDCCDSLEFSAEYMVNLEDVPVKGKENWVIAVMYNKKHEYTSSQCSQFLEDNVAAFTNPIYIIK